MSSTPIRFREKAVAYTPPGIATTSERKPGDEATPMHTFRFNYAPEPVLLAQGLIPSTSHPIHVATTSADVCFQSSIRSLRAKQDEAPAHL